MLCILLFPCALSARLPAPEGSEDIADLARSASLVFHARIVSFDTTRDAYGGEAGIVNLDVDRWYRGQLRPAAVRLNFVYSPSEAANGHSCVNLHRSDSWLIFANPKGPDTVEFSHDCEGGLPMSAVLADEPTGTWIERLQQDLIAGLRDGNEAFRLATIARLGGLKLASSKQSLTPFIEHGSTRELKWAVYAALRSGDLTVLPPVEKILIAIDTPRQEQHIVIPPEQDAAPTKRRGIYPSPDFDIALELGNIRDRRAVPALIRSLQSAKDGSVRSCAAQALAEIKDPASLAAMADHLAEPNSSVRYYALILVMSITHQPECTFSPGLQEDAISAIVHRCETWWQQSGRDIVRADSSQF